MRFRCLLIIFCLGLIPATSHAAEKDTAQAEPNDNQEAQARLPLPRFVSLRSVSVNMRTGPGERYPIEWVVTRKNLPVEITAEHDVWRRIKLQDGSEGWVHKTMLSGKRSALSLPQATQLKASPSNNARNVAQINGNAIGQIDKCENQWCQIAFGNYKGWLPQNNLWGIYSSESFK